MRIRRGPLFWGLLLIPLGAIPLLARAGVVDVGRIGDVARFWPLVLVGIGLAILLGRGRASVIGTAIVAVLLGSLGGVALASGDLSFGGTIGCVPGASDMVQTTEEGTFQERASVTIDLDCGSVDLAATEGGDSWVLDARFREEGPEVSATGSSLDVRSPDGGTHRQEWELGVPAATLDTITLTANAGAATLELAGADMDRFDGDVNAWDLRLDAGDASIDELDLSMNAGRARITLGASVEGSISANAGALELCVPSDAALRFEVEEQFTFATNLEERGLTRDGDTWTRSGTSDTVIELDIEGNAASLTLDPDGGC
jgi:hypothetical protein